MKPRICQASTIFRFLLPLLLTLSTVSAWAQQQIITGTVTENDESIPGVTVTVKGTTTGTVTDNNGEYRLAVPSDQETLVFSFVGMKAQEIATQGRSAINVSMEPDLAELDEVVVIGYGSRERKDVTTSVSQIGSEAIVQNVAMSPEAAMQGRMSGVQVSGATGNPFSRPTIRIRGVNTWGVASPLYVIDGIPITEFGAGIEGESPGVNAMRGPLNIMSMINPNDIESISVLKDASAAAVYGVRAANGVILITTKQGRTERPTIDFNARTGIQNIYQQLDVLDVGQYVAHANFLESQLDDGSSFFTGDNEGVFDQADPRYLGNTSFQDWQRAVKQENALFQDYTVRLTNRTDRSNYYISLGYADMRGTLVGNDLERYSAAIKVNTDVKDWLSAGINYRLSYAVGNDNTNEREPLYWQASTPPWQLITDPSDPFGYHRVVGGIQEDGTYSNAKLFGGATRNNFLGINQAQSSEFTSLRNLGSVYLEIKPLPSLSIKGTYSVDQYTTFNQRFMDYRGAHFRWVFGDPRQLGGGSSEGRLQENEITNTNTIREITVNYTKSFGEHNLNVLLNATDQQFGAKFENASTDFVSSRQESLRIFGGENNFSTISSVLSNTALQGWLGRMSYNYASKYYLDATIRYDGTNRFSPENRWGVFPSASAAWRLSDEPFMQGASWLDDLKLRAGWGQLGNMEVAPNTYLSSISNGGAFVFGNAGGGLGYRSYGGLSTTLPTPELNWERTTTFNVGVDATLFRGLELSAEYYHKVTSDILQRTSLPPSAGLSEVPWGNIAAVRNTGIEVSLNYRNQIGAFSYGIGGNFTTVENVVLETYEGNPQGGNIEVGKPIFYARALQVGGILQTQEEVDAYLDRVEDPAVNRDRIGPGDFWFIDQGRAPGEGEEGANYVLEADGVIDGYDAVMIGNTVPGYFYGLTLDAAYRGFDLAAQFTGVGDVVKYNWIRKQMEYTGAPGNNVTTNVLTDSWTPENPGATLPRRIARDPAANSRTSDHYWEDADYFRLSNLQLGYTMPSALLQRLGGAITNVRIFVGASNLITITPYSGFDPETGAGQNSRPSNDVNSNPRANNPDDYPTPRTYFTGLSVSF